MCVKLNLWSWVWPQTDGTVSRADMSGSLPSCFLCLQIILHSQDRNSDIICEKVLIAMRAYWMLNLGLYLLKIHLGAQMIQMHFQMSPMKERWPGWAEITPVEILARLTQVGFWLNFLPWAELNDVQNTSGISPALCNHCMCCNVIARWRSFSHKVQLSFSVLL